MHNTETTVAQLLVALCALSNFVPVPARLPPPPPTPSALRKHNTAAAYVPADSRQTPNRRCPVLRFAPLLLCHPVPSHSASNWQGWAFVATATATAPLLEQPARGRGPRPPPSVGPVLLATALGRLAVPLDNAVELLERNSVVCAGPKPKP